MHAVSSNQLEHGVAADVPHHQAGQAGGGGEHVAEPEGKGVVREVEAGGEPEGIHPKERGSREFQMFQTLPILLDALEDALKIPAAVVAAQGDLGTENTNRR